MHKDFADFCYASPQGLLPQSMLLSQGQPDQGPRAPEIISHLKGIS